MLGVILESTGKLAWLRQAPELHKYITEELGGVLLEKHTKTGLNTSKGPITLSEYENEAFSRSLCEQQVGFFLSLTV